MGIWDQFDDEEEDEAFREAMEMAEAVKDGWGAREQLEACLAVAEAALLSKAAKAQRREEAEEERRREARESALAAQREREEREAREIVAAREREALRVRREREGRQFAIPTAPAGPIAEELRRQERERQVAAEERAAKVRLANAQAAEIEAKAELMRAQARVAARSASVVTTGRAGERSAQPGARPEPRARASVERVPRGTSERRGARTALEVAVKAQVADTGKAAPAPSESTIEAADRAALMSVGRWPPPPSRPDSPFWTADADWPADWTLTGYDLAIFRGHLNVSQAVFAGQVGVPTVEIARAEAKPKAKVRPALQVAVRAAMEEARKARETRLAAEVVGTVRASPVAAVAGGPTAVGPVDAPGPAAPERGALTGADLARWRAAAGLTQREAAAKLGVAHGTVAKAELASGKQLGKQMEEALEAARRT